MEFEIKALFIHGVQTTGIPSKNWGCTNSTGGRNTTIWHIGTASYGILAFTTRDMTHRIGGGSDATSQVSAVTIHGVKCKILVFIFMNAV